MILTAVVGEKASPIRGLLIEDRLYSMALPGRLPATRIQGSWFINGIGMHKNR